MNYTDLSEKSLHDENSNHWFTKDRSETSSNRVSKKSLDNGVLVENLALGVNAYQNVFSLEDSKRYINTLESSKPRQNI